MKKYRSALYVGKGFVDSQTLKHIPGVMWPFGSIELNDANLRIKYFTVDRLVEYTDISKVSMAPNGYMQVTTTNGKDFGFSGPNTSHILKEMSLRDIRVDRMKRASNITNLILTLLLVVGFVFALFAIFEMVRG